ncbi:MAG: hypothetical protein KF767_18665 [Bdellovibrionaceae bacterium]|nr:hypothetical protein [Pseudobdellovibrionaceae bacterium]
MSKTHSSLRSLIWMMVGAALFTQTPAQAFLSSTFQVKLQVPAVGEVFDPVSQTKTPLKAQESIEVTLNEPKIVQLDGHIPMMIVPIKDGLSELKLNPPTIKDATAHLVQGEISMYVSEIVQGIEDVRTELRMKRYDNAMTRVQQLQSKYPKVAFLEFIKASVYFLQGRKSDARTAASIGLKAHPDFEEGRKFIKSLGGEGQ